MQPALNAPMAEKIPMPVSDADFKKLVAVIRCAVPYTGQWALSTPVYCMPSSVYIHKHPSTTHEPPQNPPGMILSTRESAATRRDLLQLGISQISAGSRTDVGALKGEISRMHVSILMWVLDFHVCTYRRLPPRHEL
jgi:2-iminoacetate synthase